MTHGQRTILFSSALLLIGGVVYGAGIQGHVTKAAGVT